MKTAIIGSRTLNISSFDRYISESTTEIISGGAKGIDRCAKEYALKNGISYKEFLPDYRRYGKGAPLKRDREMVMYADEILAFWDGKSHGTRYTAKFAMRLGKAVKMIICANDGSYLVQV